MRIELDKVAIDKIIAKLDYYDMVEFLRENSLNLNKQWVELLSQSDDNFSVEKFLIAIEYWEQD